MALLSPALLYALGALAVPILLHLFSFRRHREVAFSDVRFLREVREETHDRARLRNRLVLALRLLAVAAIVLAFAQPLTPADARRADAGARAVAVYVDNSFSMAAQAGDVSLLERARQRAREIVGAYDESTRFQLLTNELAGAAGRPLTRDDALAAVDEIGVAPESRSLAAVRARLRGDVEVAYYVTDLQASQLGDPAALDRAGDSARVERFVAVSPVAARNVSVDSVRLASPVQLVGEATELLVTLTNHGDDDAEAVRLSARVRGRQQPFGTEAVPARSTVVDTVRLAALAAGPADVEVAITDFPVEFDDAYRVSFPVRGALRGLAIGGEAPNRSLAAAFGPGGGLVFDHVSARAVGYGDLARYDLVVLEDLASPSSGLVRALVSYARAGGKVLAFPGPDADAAAYGDLLAAAGLPRLAGFREGSFAGGRLNDAAFEFTDVFERLPRNLALPSASGRFALEGRGGETLLAFRDGEPLVVAGDLGAGRVYLAAVPLDPSASDLSRSGEVFVPMLYRMALAGRAARPASYVVGSSEAAVFPLPPSIGEAALRLVGEASEFVPAQRRLGDELAVSFAAAPREAGFYRLVDEADSTLAHVAFNYDRRESPQDFLDPADLEALGFDVYDGSRPGAVAAAVTDDVEGAPWWPPLVALALAALVAETLVLRFWRPGKARGSAPADPPPARRSTARPLARQPIPAERTA